jgi:serine/threonine protein phosphatase PrpC
VYARAASTTQAALFCGRNFAAAVRDAPAYAAGDLPGALRAAFRSVDAQLCSDAGRQDMLRHAMEARERAGKDADAAAKEAKAHAKEGLLRYAASRGADVALVSAALEAHYAQPPGGPHCGCTALVALVRAPQIATFAFLHSCLTLLSRHLQIRGDALHIAHCGDSRAVLCCAGGTAAALTVDHVPSLPSEAARIAAAGGFVCADGRVGGTLALSRALGDAAYKQAAHLPPERQAVVSTPDVMSMQMHPGQHEFLLLACDGLWDVRSNQAAVDFVRPRLAEGIAPAEVAAQLCGVCIADDTQQLAGLGCDNVSVVLIVLPASREHSSDGEVETPSSCEQLVHRRGSLKRHAPHAVSDEVYDGDSGSDGEEEEEEIAFEQHVAKRQSTRRQTTRGVTCEG